MGGNKLFVGNLSFSSSEGELEQLFAEHGTVENVKIIANKGFGFVEMAKQEEAEAAKEALNLSMFGGRNINVSDARPMKPRNDNGSGRY
jgi:RNA recognition motif-containing protein